MIETITDREGFLRLRNDWSSLLPRCAASSVFLTWEWLFTWWNHLGADRQPRILAVRRDGRLIAIAPFAIRPPSLSRLVPFRAVEFLGSGTVGSDYLDLIVGPGEEAGAVSEIGSRLERMGLPVELPQMRLDGSAGRLMSQRMASRGWSLVNGPTSVCPFIPLAGRDWSEYVATLGSAHRANLHRRLRGLNRIGEVRFEPVRSDAERRQALSRLIFLHNLRWSARGGSDAFDTPEKLAFHQEFSRLAMDNGWLRLLVLKVGGAEVAFFYGFRFDGVFSFYQSAFDPAWSSHSVGLVAMGLAIRTAIEEGAAEFDLLHGDERYKYHWAGEERSIGRLELHAPPLRGWLTRGASEIGRTARRLGRRALARTLAPTPQAPRAVPAPEGEGLA